MDEITVVTRDLVNLATKIERLNNLVKSLKARTEDKMINKWMNTHDICMVLNVSVRTIQTYRDNCLLPYSQIGMKIFYKPEDVESLLLNNRN